MDILWRSLDSVTPLFRCLPEEFWTLGRLGPAELDYDPDDFLVDNDWKCFLRSATRIRALRILDECYVESAMHLFAFSCPCRDAFLSLRTLHWKYNANETPERLLYLTPLLGPNLTTLRIRSDDELAIVRILRMAQQRCPGFVSRM
ncbi:hypothetical protein K474DRAFT_1473240 [Panus rudis PR-1116 ss-1]|nr:hypothetical protein K474DRAFT_1473240 [Panus rudis PR-1116 ss-1]